MSTIATQLEKSKGLLNALDALGNRRAFTCLLATAVACGLVFALNAFITGRFVMNGHTVIASIVGLSGGLLSLLIGLTGASATGFILNAHMRQREAPTLSDALMTALATLPRLIGIFLLLGCVLLGLALVILLLLLLCKIPGLGMLLYALVFPLSVVVMGVALTSALYVTLLAGPAVWNGHGLMQAVGLLIAIAQKRLLAVIVQTLLLGLLVGVVGAVVFGVLAAGISATTILSIPVLGFGSSPGMGGMGALLMGSSSGYAAAGMFGTAILSAATGALPALIAIAGYCLIFAAVADGLDTRHIEERIRATQDKARAGLDNARAQMASKPAAQSSDHTAPATAEDNASPTLPACPSCQQAVAAEDVFCDNCGHKLD